MGMECLQEASDTLAHTLHGLAVLFATHKPLGAPETERHDSLCEGSANVSHTSTSTLGTSAMSPAGNTLGHTTGASTLGTAASTASGHRSEPFRYILVIIFMCHLLGVGAILCRHRGFSEHLLSFVTSAHSRSTHYNIS